MRGLPLAQRLSMVRQMPNWQIDSAFFGGGIAF